MCRRTGRCGIPPRRRLVTDFVIQELDLPSMDVLFEWHALDHVPPAATYQRRPPAPYSWDYFHGNSIEPPGADGTILVSARNTSAVYGIDRATGALLWTLGGKLDDFGLVRRHPGRQFCAQHDARRRPAARSRCSTTAARCWETCAIARFTAPAHSATGSTCAGAAPT